ncbi:MAG: hypothetical protein WAN37_02800, partial [Bryobacteraceae bacterium]
IAARRITEGKERIDLILSAIQRAHINVVSTRIIGWLERTAKVREAPATPQRNLSTYSFLSPAVSLTSSNCHSSYGSLKPTALRKQDRRRHRRDTPLP